MKHPLWILNSSLLVFLTAVLCFIFFFREEAPSWESLDPISPTRPIKQQALDVNISKIYENDLFDTYEKIFSDVEKTSYVSSLPQPPIPKQISIPSQVEPTFLEPLSIGLKGIITSMLDDTKNRAIITDNATQNERVYKVGDFIEDAQLIKIFSKKIIFLRANGQQEVLYLREKDAQDDPTYALLDNWKNIAEKINETTFLIHPTEFTLRIKSLAQLIDILDLTTAYQKGKSVGCRVNATTQNHLASQLGLRYGDIILSINDIPATTTLHRFSIYKNIITLKEKSTTKIIISRNKTPLQLNFILGEFEKPSPSLSAESTEIQKELQENRAKQEKRKIMEQNHTFAPTLKELRARERKNMLQKGKSHSKSLTSTFAEQRP